jgi:hypothetical protein
LAILAVVSEDLVDLAAGGGVVPALQLADQNQARTGTAAVAEVRASSVPIIKAKSVLAAADRAWAMPICKEPRLDAERRQDHAPTPTGALDGIRAASRFANAFA